MKQTPSIGLGGLLGVAFIVLKLCHVINWSWWWVTCPLWAPIVITLAVLGGMFAFSLVAWIIERSRITLEEYNTRFRRQKGRCEICACKLKKPVVDHSHKTNKVRGILCYCCNSALGFFQDSREILKKASAYLKRHE